MDRALSVAIIIPCLARPQNVAPLVDSIEAFTPKPYRILFVCDPGDVPEQDAIAAAGCEMISPGGGYSTKIRAGIEATTNPLVFTGADDLCFTADWLEAATARMTETIQVIGVNDGIRRRRRPEHATHFLMTREYATRPTIDDTPGPFSDAYIHSFIDDEFLATATSRGVYAYAPDSLVQHLHWMNGLAPDDGVYRLGRAEFANDRATFAAREHLWT